MNGKINTEIIDDFTVLDLTGVRKSGITLTDFTKKLYNSTGTEVSGTITVTITELELGNYRASFTPNVIGIWKLVVTHATYFPQGKENDYIIYNEDFDSLDTAISNIPTNPMLATENGTSFTSIPDMAKESTLTKIKGTGFVENIDSLVNLSHTSIEISAQLVRNAMALALTSGSPAVGSIDEKLNNIPTNTMLSTETGSSFTSIPNMAKETSLLSVSGVISTGFVSGAKESSLDDMKGTGFVKDVDSLKNLSHTNIEITSQLVRDAMKLSPSSGTIALESIDKKLDDLKVLNAHVPSANFDPY